jgi:3-dehydroquinate synthase
MANALSVKLNLMSEDEANRIKELLTKYDLPIHYNTLPTDEFYQAFFHDKKTFDSKIKFILASSIGGYEMRDDIDKDTVISTLEGAF